MPETRHYHCNDCNSSFSRTTGDAIGLIRLSEKCPFCGGSDITLAELNAVKEGFDFIRHGIAKIFRSENSPLDK